RPAVPHRGNAERFDPQSSRHRQPRKNLVRGAITHRARTRYWNRYGPSDQWHGDYHRPPAGGSAAACTWRCGGIAPSRLIPVADCSIVFAIATLAMMGIELLLVESREAFLANISHELRTPLQ